MMLKSADKSIGRFFPILFYMAAVFGTNNMLLGQVSEGGIPYSFSTSTPGNIPTISMASVDVAALLAEDEAEMQQDEPVPYRFGYAFEVDLGLDNAGTWIELPNGDRLWRLRIIAPGAFSINLIYNEFWLPEGARFFIYNANQSMVIGAFTATNNKQHGKFSTAPVKGNISILEYYEPASVQGLGMLHVSRVVHAYRNFFGPSDAGGLGKVLGTQGFGDSGSCNNNVNCPEGQPWYREKSAAVMILTSGGTRFCSGAMINNVEEDLIPYLLTANHCLGGEATWIIMFNYESPSCSNINGPTNQTVSGTTLKAHYSASDFALLRLSTSPPSSYHVHYAGWSRSASAATSTVGIHHPKGDIKKISFDDDTAVSDKYLGTSGAANSHWKVIWDDGTTQSGSSGSPLFNEDHLVVGQLHGGYASCSAQNERDWYGKFSLSWSGGGSSSTRLKDWLDPNNTDPTTLDGIGIPAPPTNLYISGFQGGMPRIDWTASASSNVDHYELWSIQIVGPPYGWQLLAPRAGTWWVDSRVTMDNSSPEDQYGYKALAVSLGGQDSDFSNAAYVLVDECPPWMCKKLTAELGAIPEDYALGENYPNPFNPNTTIQYDLPEASRVRLTIYDLMGKKVYAHSAVEEAGYWQMTWQGKDHMGKAVPSGVYIYRLVAISTANGSHFTATRKMLLLK